MKKNIANENFPIGKFIRKKFRPIVDAYYWGAREADDIADSLHLSEAEKISLLDKCYQDFMSASSSTNAGRLGKIFVAENLDYRLYTDLLEAFYKDAKGFFPEIWEQLLEYCHYSAFPVGRFLLALHNQNPITYMPAETLCAVLQITDHLHDIKSDACNLHRCYIPQDFLTRFDVRMSDFCLDKSTPSVKALLLELVERLQSMLSDSKIIISLISDIPLKFELGVIISLTNSMLKKIEKGDVIYRTPSLNIIDWGKAIMYGIWSSVFVRTKSCNIIK